MIELTEVLARVGATTKTKEKQELIVDIENDTKKLLYLTYNPFITFGVKKLPEYGNIFAAVPEWEELDQFFDLCDKLARRELTGHAALDAISKVLSGYSECTADTLAKVLRKDLQVNLAIKSINKVHKGLIPVFDCMLADKMDHRFDWDTGPWFVEYKYDGMRIVAQVIGDSVKCLSRAGIEQEKYAGVFDEYLLAMREVYGKDFYADGEVLAATFQDTMKSRGKDGDTSKLVYRIFDFIDADEWEAHESEISQMDRYYKIVGLVESTTSALEASPQRSFEEDDFGYFVFDDRQDPRPTINVMATEGKICWTKEELNEYYNELIDERRPVGERAEGVIIKNMNAPYYWKRNRAWTKYKPVYDADLKVVGRYAGKADSKMSNTLGGIQLEGYLEDGTFVTCDCGSGFSEELRDELWAMDLDELMERTVEVEYQEVSKTDDAEHHSLRFPIFKRFRDDK